MRILFNGFQQPHLLPALQGILQAFGLSYCAAIDETRRLGPECEVDQHDFWKILWGEYPVPDHEIRPLDAETIRDLASCETMVLRMMDRMDPLHPKPYAFRKSLYLRHLQYWNDFLDRKAITHFVTFNVPHEMHDYVVYELCRKKGIKTWMFLQAGIPGKTFLFRDIEQGPQELVGAFTAVRESAGGTEFVDLPAAVESYWQAQAGSKSAPPPFYMKGVTSQLKRSHSFGYVVGRSISFTREFIQRNEDVTFKSLGGLVLAGRRRYSARQALIDRDKRLWQYYDRMASTPQPGQPYVYIPLHYQPECTTCPMGGLFVDQELMVKILASTVPEGVALCVKEHPVQRSQGRTVEFYEDLLRLPNVRLIRKDVPSADLIRGALAVATVTGTAGWEALFAGIPVLMFGSFFYQYCPGVHNVRSSADARTAFSAIKRGESPRLFDLRCFVRAVCDVAITGYSDPLYSETAWVSEEESAKNIAAALVNRLRN